MSADFEKNNPAGRLYTLVRKAKTVSDGPPVQFWATVFAINYRDLGNAPILEVVDKLGHFLLLVDDVERGFRELAFEEFYFEPFDPLRKVVDGSLRGLAANHGNIFGPVTSEHIAYLKVGAVEWSKRNPDPPIDDKKLKEIEKQARELRDAVKASPDIASDLRNLIVSLMESILEAIEQYKVGSVTVLEEAGVHVLGQFYWNARLVLRTFSDSKAKKWLKRAGAVVGMFIAVVSYGEKGWKSIETISSVTEFLTSGEPEIPIVDLTAENEINPEDLGK